MRTTTLRALGWLKVIAAATLLAHGSVAAAAGEVLEAPTELRFPPVLRCGGHSELSFTVGNAGPPTAGPMTYWFDLPSNQYASVNAPQCPGRRCAGVLGPGESATIDATYTSSCGDGASFDMVIFTDIPDLFQVVWVQLPVGYGRLEPTYPELHFGDGPVGQPLPPQALRMRNVGPVPLQIYAMIPAPEAGELIQITGGPVDGTLAPDEEATWTVTVTPASHGAHAFASIFFNTDGQWPDPEGRLSFRAWGEGVVATPDLLDFGVVRIGTSALRSYQLRNSGTSAHTLLEVARAPSSVFALSLRDATMPKLLAPGEEVTVDVVYTRTAPAPGAPPWRSRWTTSPPPASWWSCAPRSSRARRRRRPPTHGRPMAATAHPDRRPGGW